MLSTGLLTRAETAAGLTRLLHRGMIKQEDYNLALESFHRDWNGYQRIPINEELMARADSLACQHSLQGYDAVHLASALIW